MIRLMEDHAEMAVNGIFGTLPKKTYRAGRYCKDYELTEKIIQWLRRVTLQYRLKNIRKRR